MKWDINVEEFYEMDEEDLQNELDKLKPSDFYFQAGHDIMNNVYYFTIVPKPYYDANKCQSDFALGHLSVIPPGFDELAESDFEYNGDHVLGRQILLQAGFIEKKMF